MPLHFTYRHPLLPSDNQRNTTLSYATQIITRSNLRHRLKKEWAQDVVSTELLLKIQVPWGVTPCRVVSTCRRYVVSSVLRNQFQAVLDNFSQCLAVITDGPPTQRNIPKTLNIQKWVALTVTIPHTHTVKYSDIWRLTRRPLNEWGADGNASHRTGISGIYLAPRTGMFRRPWPAATGITLRRHFPHRIPSISRHDYTFHTSQTTISLNYTQKFCLYRAVNTLPHSYTNWTVNTIE